MKKSVRKHKPLEDGDEFSPNNSIMFSSEWKIQLENYIGLYIDVEAVIRKNIYNLSYYIVKGVLLRNFQLKSRYNPE